MRPLVLFAFEIWQMARSWKLNEEILYILNVQYWKVVDEEPGERDTCRQEQRPQRHRVSSPIAQTTLLVSLDPP